MSRRTKLLITALFLVLLAIPVIYIALTWSPPMPLRFRVLEVRWKPEDQADTMVPVRITVENTGFHPVHLLVAQVMARDTPPVEGVPLGSISPEVQNAEGFSEGTTEPLIIPAHGTVAVWAMIQSDVVRHAESGQLRLACFWISGTKYRADNLCDWMHIHLPSWLVSRVPRIEYKQDEVPLDAMVEP